MSRYSFKFCLSFCVVVLSTFAAKADSPVLTLQATCPGTALRTTFRQTLQPNRQPVVANFSVVATIDEAVAASQFQPEHIDQPLVVGHSLLLPQSVTLQQHNDAGAAPVPPLPKRRASSLFLARIPAGGGSH